MILFFLTAQNDSKSIWNKRECANQALKMCKQSPEFNSKAVFDPLILHSANFNRHSLRLYYPNLFNNQTQTIMINVENTLNDLRAVPTTTTGAGSAGDLCYIKGHSNVTDGGGGMFYFDPAVPATMADNDGTIIKPNDVTTGNGRWIRKFEGAINVRYFGAFGQNVNETVQIQRAIDFAASNKFNNLFTDCNTVYIPSGIYKLDTLVLKDGVNLQGDSTAHTWLIADSTTNDPVIIMEAGPVTHVHVSNLRFIGENQARTCFYLQAQVSGTTGGLWHSSFRNIYITNFEGHGFHMESGVTGYNLANQFNIFENVFVQRSAHNVHSLWMHGYHGQHTFINCEFDGKGYIDSGTGSTFQLKGANVRMSGDGFNSPIVASFLNCSFQSAEYGILIDNAESITVDNCWFENLDRAVTVQGTTTHSNKAIRVVNSRFANAAGFGSLSVGNANPQGTGYIVHSKNSDVAVLNNYVVVSDPAVVEPWAAQTMFITADSDNNGITALGNSFQRDHLGYSHGVSQNLSVQASGSGNFLDTDNNLTVQVAPTGITLEVINSTINVGEQLTLVAKGGPLTIASTHNIFLTNRTSLTLQDGEVAIFTKVDDPIGTTYREYYQLVSLVTTATP